MLKKLSLAVSGKGAIQAMGECWSPECPCGYINSCEKISGHEWCECVLVSRTRNPY
jgi:hypothetical protein